MVVIKGLSTSKIRVAGEREARKNGRVRSLKVYTEDDKVKIRNEDHAAAETKRKPIPVKVETNHINADIQKEALNKLEKLIGKDINSVKVGRKVLADISNSRGVFQKNDTFDGSRPGKNKMKKIACSQRASVGTKVSNAISSSGKDLKIFNGNPNTRVQGQETVGHIIRASAATRASMASSSSGKYLKVFNGNQKTRLQGQETAGHVTRKSARSYVPPQRKSFPILKRVDKVDKCDPKKGNLELKVKNKETCGFSVKPKVGVTVIPPVSTAPNNRWKHRVSEGSIKMVSEGQSSGDAKRLSRISIKPTVKTTVGIPKAKRVSRSISVFTKPTSASFALSKQEATSGSSFSKNIESVSREQNLDASTSNIIAKGKKSGRRKSYTSLLIERTELLKDEGNVTKEEILPNIYDDGNPLEVAEYVDEIYRHYWVTEAHNPSLKNYMEIQTDITPQMRGILIHWLIEVHLKFDLMQETLYLMVTLLDYYWSVVTIKRSEMQLVGLTSLLLASKYEDFWHPKVMELISISAEIYTRDQMLEMETTILTKLNFRLNLPTPYVFMLRFLRAAQAGKKFENLAFFLIELCLVEYDALHFKPSLLCASAIYVARCTLNLTPAWTPLLCKHSHYEEFQIRDCADMILRFHKAARTTLLRVTYDKFMSNDKGKVASIKPLDKLPSP